MTLELCSFYHFRKFKTAHFTCKAVLTNAFLNTHCVFITVLVPGDRKISTTRPASSTLKWSGTMFNTCPRYHVTAVKLSTAAWSRAASWAWRVDTAVMGRGTSQASRTWPTGQVMVCSRSWTGGLNDINRGVLGSSLKPGEI